jgi:hypothetical protein
MHCRLDRYDFIFFRLICFLLLKHKKHKTIVIVILIVNKGKCYRLGFALFLLSRYFFVDRINENYKLWQTEFKRLLETHCLL